MTNLELFIYIWLSFATIKTIIIIGTGLEVAIEEKEDAIITVIGTVLTSLIAGIGVFFIWPILLFTQKMKFFSFPDLQYKTKIADEIILRENDK